LLSLPHPASVNVHPMQRVDAIDAMVFIPRAYGSGMRIRAKKRARANPCRLLPAVTPIRGTTPMIHCARARSGVRPRHVVYAPTLVTDKNRERAHTDPGGP
jgi:hypothetical protein